MSGRAFEVMNLKTLLVPVALGVTGCSALALDDDEVNDTQIGDDEAGGDEGPEFFDPDPIDPAYGRGGADYVVARVNHWHSENHPDYDTELTDRINQNERWGRLDVVGINDSSSKPSPLQVPMMRTPGDDLNAYYDAYTAQDSGLYGAYSVALPEVVFEPSPGPVQFPFYRNLAVATIGNPIDSGRFNSMFENCGWTEPTPLERQEHLGKVISPTMLQEGGGWDCGIHIAYKGVQHDVIGYPSIYTETDRIRVAQASAVCVTGFEEYANHEHVGTSLTSMGDYSTNPAILNYEWMEGSLEVDWEAIGLVDQVGAALGFLLEKLITWAYYPPEEYPQPRYGAGGGCAYAAKIKYETQWRAQTVCPNGYYEAIGDHDHDGVPGEVVEGHCKVDGVSWADPPSPGESIGEDAPGGVRGYGVDFEAFASRMDAVTLKAGDVVDAATAALFVDMLDADGEPLVREGDVLQWWRAPEGEATDLGESFRRVAGWDLDALDELGEALGLEEERTREWVTMHGPAPVIDFIDDEGAALEGELTPELADKRVNEIRPQVWSFRVESDGLVKPVYVSAY